jgi:hypothetical protein
MMSRAPRVFVLALLLVSASSAADDLDALMHLLALRQHGQVSFVEQQFLAIANRPLESSGELFYDAPDRLEKRTLTPRSESLLLAGDVLTVERGRRKRVLDLRAYPQIRPFVESIRGTLAGDRRALEHVFSVEFAGNLQRWTLRLAPLDPQVAKTVLQVQIDGSQDQLLTVEIRQADGDRSLMTLRASSPP